MTIGTWLDYLQFLRTGHVSVVISLITTFVPQYAYSALALKAPKMWNPDIDKNYRHLIELPIKTPQLSAAKD